MIARLGLWLFLALAGTMFLASAAIAAAPQPDVRGNQIFDSVTSRVFVPHGVNFPGYEYACQQGWDYGEEGTKPADVESTVAAIASWRINTVRLPLNQDCWLGDDGLPSGSLTVTGYRNSVESFVEALNRVGIVAILDLHWSGPNGVVANGLRPMPDARSTAFWNSVATRFKENPSIIFDVFNEPHSRWNVDDTLVFSLSWNCWTNGGCLAPAEPDTLPISGLSWFQTTGLSSLIAAVRNTGAGQPIMLSGVDYANDLRKWKDHAPKDSQLIAGFHNYLVQRCRTVTCWDREIAPLAKEVPVLAAEFGQNDCGRPDHMTRFMEWADQRRVGYLAWAWWHLPVLGCSNFALISSLDGTPLAPVGTALREHLATLPDLYDPVVPKPDPIIKRDPGLRLKLISWRRQILKFRLAINPRVSSSVRLRVPLVRDLRSRLGRASTPVTLRRAVRVKSGSRMLRVRISRGLRPRAVIARFPGDRRFGSRVARAKVPSVSRLTRDRRPQ